MREIRKSLQMNKTRTRNTKIYRMKQKQCLEGNLQLSRVRPFATPWTAAHQAPLSMGFFRQEHWSGLPSPPGDVTDPGIDPRSPALQAESLLSEPLVKSLRSLFLTLSLLSLEPPMAHHCQAGVIDPLCLRSQTFT